MVGAGLGAQKRSKGPIFTFCYSSKRAQLSETKLFWLILRVGAPRGGIFKPQWPKVWWGGGGMDFDGMGAFSVNPSGDRMWRCGFWAPNGWFGRAYAPTRTELLVLRWPKMVLVARGAVRFYGSKRPHSRPHVGPWSMAQNVPIVCHLSWNVDLLSTDTKGFGSFMGHFGRFDLFWHIVKPTGPIWAICSKQ